MIATVRHRTAPRSLRSPAGMVGRAITEQTASLEFEDPNDPAVVYLETYDDARYPEAPPQVARFRRRSLAWGR